MPEAFSPSVAVAGTDMAAALSTRLALCEHDPASVARGTVTTNLHAPTFAALRRLSAATDAERRARQAVFWAPQIAERAGYGQGVHDRLEAYVFAGGPKQPEDEARAAAHLPFPTLATSMHQHRVAAGATWDLSVRGAHFGLDDRDDLLRIVNLGTLHLEAGARVVVRGNLLMLTIEHLICAGTGDQRPQLMLLPTPFSQDLRRGAFNGAHGAPGASGQDGAAGEPPRTLPSILGPQLTGTWHPQMAHGAPGGPGEPGSDGADGRTGGATKTAEITLGAVTGEVTIVAAAGHGGHGGNGGDGGAGGRGGRASEGVHTSRGTVESGRGGRGGDGGQGGAGGRGGNSGIASNVFISVPAGAGAQVHIDARAGSGGHGGHGGAPGAGGPGGAGPHPGSTGSAAPRGADGGPGRDRPAPPVLLYERAQHDPTGELT